MRRRTLLRTGGIALAGGAGLATTAGAARPGDADPRPADREGTLPSDGLPTGQVDPLTGPFQTHEVPAGTWIYHSIEWAADDCTTIDLLMEHTDDVVRVAGEQLAAPERFWAYCLEEDEHDYHLPGQRLAVWRYFTPPKPVGTYEFSWEVRFTGDVPGIGAAGDVVVNAHPYEVVRSTGPGAPGGASVAAASGGHAAGVGAGSAPSSGGAHPV